MAFGREDMIKAILDSLRHMEYIKSSEIPNIDLYMDQVTTFMDSHLGAGRRHKEDKVLTKTMINNYTKNHLLPPPTKKKYSREHLLILIFIYYFKGLLSFQDIQTILTPLTQRYFQTDEKPGLDQIYERIFQLGTQEMDVILNDVERIWQTSSGMFEDAPPEDQEFLDLLALICLLSFDVYMKKQMIERLIDDFAQENEQTKKGKK